MSVYHGGNLAGAAQLFGVPERGWVDLSTGINPNPYPIPDLDGALWARLPDSDLLESLKEAAAFYYGVADRHHIIPVSGTQTLLQILPHLFEKSKAVRILAPTYKEHEFCWRLAGHDVAEVEDIFQAEKEGEIVIIVNPNNPTGDVYDPETLLALAERLHNKGGCLIVDGAFMDCTPVLDVSSFVGTPGLVVLRSFGKFFGLAGLRLGFVLVHGVLAQRLKDGIGPWAVNGPAMEIGRRALKDVHWITHTRKALAQAAVRLDDILVSGGLEIVGGTSLFRYCRHENAMKLYEAMGHTGILVRPFMDRPNYLRFGLPGEEAHWQRLQKFMENDSL